MGVEDEEILKKISCGKSEGVVILYNKFKSDFIKWTLRYYNLDEQNSLDIFQDVIIVFYKSIKEKKVTQFTSSVKTYLYAIAKNMIRNKFRYESRFEEAADNLDFLTTESLAEKWEINEEAKTLITTSIEKLGEPCRTILKLYYYQEYSHEQISKETQSKNANVVKVQKCRCMDKLTELIKGKFNREDLL